MGAKRVVLISLGLLLAGLLTMVDRDASAERDAWESALETMQKGALQMIQGAKLLQNKKDFARAEKAIKEGHRTMMQAEKAAIHTQKETIKQGARMMTNGLQALRSLHDTQEAEKLMAQGQALILKGESMLADTRPEKLMKGSRSMMRGLRMMQKPDALTAERLVRDGQSIMAEEVKKSEN